MTPFFVVIPKVINDTNFISSNVPETDYAVWNSATAYTAGQRVILTTGVHKIYESITSNTNKNPVTSITDWVEVSPTNRWKMFDSSGGTITSNANSIVFSFSADKVTSMGFLDLTAQTVQIVGTQGATEFYNQTFDIPDKAIVEDWYAYFTADPFRATELTVKDIPAVFGATWTITISNPGVDAKCGNFICGNFIELGKTQYGASASIIDYSVKEVDAFGKATIVQRPFSKRMDVNLWVNASAVDSVTARLNTLRATPCLWVGSKDAYEALSVFGFFRDYNMSISYPSYSVLALSIEGLT